MMTLRTSLLIALSALPGTVMHAAAQDTVLCREALVLPYPASYADVVIAPNPIEARMASGTWRAPAAGQEEVFHGGYRARWTRLEAGKDGWFTGDTLNNAMLRISVRRPERGVVLLEGMGDEMAFVNGEPRTGNPYGLKDAWEAWEPRFEYSKLPVLLSKGENEILLRSVRGRVKVRLVPVTRAVGFNGKDLTLPDLISGRRSDTWGSVVILNASEKPLRDLVLESQIAAESPVRMTVPLIQPLSVRKASFRIEAGPIAGESFAILHLTLLQGNGGTARTRDTMSVVLAVKGVLENRKVTFISVTDSSVQYYAIRQATGTGDTPAALVLSLHGADVEAINQTASYASKRGATIVAPTNRRPYGFNWEGWGRHDAMEVLSLVKRTYPIDERRIYLTGHSMGGHGTWHVGAMFPDQFAAIGPSAGWISFWTYRFDGRGDTTPVRRMLRRSTGTSETFEYVHNYTQLGVYVIHGTDDDNVPVTESRAMAERLRPIHPDFVFHEQPGVGHWWDLSDEPGADCVDWPPLFDFFARHQRPLKYEQLGVDFSTANPSVSASDRWVTIAAQERQGELSRAVLHAEPFTRRIAGTTQNIALCALDLGILEPGDSVHLELDGQQLAVRPSSPVLWLQRTNGVWKDRSAPAPGMKGTLRSGTLTEAFRRRPILVYGTRGSAEENRWAFAKARFDAEKYWYQLNGSVDVVSDTEFDPAADPDRDVVLYGNRTTNAAWRSLLGDSPVQVATGGLTVGEREFRGRSFACLFVRPRTGSAVADVGVVGGTGIEGMRLAGRIPYTTPGINVPDCTVLSPKLLSTGEDGILLTGFFGPDWSVERGEFVGTSVRQ